MTLRSWFFVHRVEPGAVAVIDCSGAPGCAAVSVTDDAEAVVAHLYEWGRLRSADRLVYKDTRGLWGGMLHQDGKFTGFLPLNAGTLEQAIDRFDLAIEVLKTPLDEPPGSVL